jgi:hypothetical protein
VQALKSRTFVEIESQYEVHALIALFPEKEPARAHELLSYTEGINDICFEIVVPLLSDRLGVGVSDGLPAIQAVLTVSLENLCNPDFALVAYICIATCNSFLFFGLSA